MTVSQERYTFRVSGIQERKPTSLEISAVVAVEYGQSLASSARSKLSQSMLSWQQRTTTERSFGIHALSARWVEKSLIFVQIRLAQGHIPVIISLSGCAPLVGERSSKTLYAGSNPVSRAMPFRKEIQIVDAEGNRMRHIRMPAFQTEQEAGEWILREGAGAWGDIMSTLNLTIRTVYTNRT